MDFATALVWDTLGFDVTGDDYTIDANDLLIVKGIALRIAVQWFTNPEDRATYSGPEGMSPQRRRRCCRGSCRGRPPHARQRADALRTGVRLMARTKSPSMNDVLDALDELANAAGDLRPVWRELGMKYEYHIKTCSPRTAAGRGAVSPTTRCACTSRRWSAKAS